VIPTAIARRIEAAIGAPVGGARRVHGGDINDAFAIEPGGRTLFVKTNGDAPAGTFEAEADGLAWLAEPGALRVPGVVAVGDDFLVLEWLEPGRRGAGFEAALGRGLARLHAAGAPGWGYRRDNFIAVLPQANQPTATWGDFWIDRRLGPLIDRAVARGAGSPGWRAAADRLRARWAEIAGPDEPPARLHGDLWRGNVHDAGGEPAVIDPAVYGGHREVDLAMLALFGGLSDRLVAAYDETTPLAPGWRERLGLWQIYPLLVHAILFGGGYAASVDAELRRYA